MRAPLKDCGGSGCETAASGNLVRSEAKLSEAKSVVTKHWFYTTGQVFIKTHFKIQIQNLRDKIPQEYITHLCAGKTKIKYHPSL